MEIAFFDTHAFEKPFFEEANGLLDSPHGITYFENRLHQESINLARGFPAICIFVNDSLRADMIQSLAADQALQLVALRSAGFNHVDIEACARLGVRVVRVPAYSPYAVAEHAVALLLTLNRKTHRAFNRVRELNFSLNGLVGFDLHGKTVGVVGLGKIGKAFARILHGFGCSILAYDTEEDLSFAHNVDARFVSLDELLRSSDIVSLHVPLMKETYHMIDAHAFEMMKPGAFLINTSRGGLVDSAALISVLKTKKLGGAALDVYEEEEGVFFHDLSESGLRDDLLARLLTFPNVLITSHQAFLTKEALAEIARVTLDNVSQFENGEALENEIRL